MKAKPNRHCAQCGQAFTCERDAGRDPCWCSDEFPARLPLPAGDSGCLCPRCLDAAIKSAPFPAKTI